MDAQARAANESPTGVHDECIIKRKKKSVGGEAGGWIDEKLEREFK